MTNKRLIEFLTCYGRQLAALGNHDFCPWANRYVYWLKQPIGWFVVAALAAGLTGAFVAPQALFVCAIVLTVIVMGTVWPWLAMRGLAAELDFDRPRCHEEDPVTVILTVRNRWPWPVWGLLVERGFFSRKDDETDEAISGLERVNGWSDSRFELTYRPPRRGVYPHETPVLGTGFPFGLWTATRPLNVAGQLTVWPRCINLRSLPMLPGDRTAPTGSFVDRPGHDGDILSARPYVRGDSLRRVHWIHTARRDTLIVCERQSVSRRRVLVVLDRSAFAASSKSDQWARDWSMRIVATLCREFHRHSCDVECELNGVRRVIPPGTVGLHRSLDQFAAYEPSRHPAEGPTPDFGTMNAGESLRFMVTSSSQWGHGMAQRGRRGSQPSARTVVLDSESDNSLASSDVARDSVASAFQPWMYLSLRGDVSRQLQQQWERRCHDDWSR